MARKVVHLIPYDGIGGVEKAAATAEGAVRGELRLERMFVFEGLSDQAQRGATYNPLSMWRAAGRLVRAEPDLVIMSLWRSVLVAMLASLRGCRAPKVLFLHNARDAHFLDRWSTRWGARHAEAIWADAQATLDQRLPDTRGVPTRVISYMMRRVEPVTGPGSPVAPNFLFWGRLAAQKDPLRMVALFARIYKLRPDARLTVIGPDAGLRASVERAIAAHGLMEAIELVGPVDWDGIAARAREASFYLQTSRYEGMALSVVEAMQLGLVPVVTPVGEIANYTEDGRNALWLGPAGEDDRAARGAVELVDQPQRWRAMRADAIKRWSERPLYAKDILEAAEDVLARGGTG